MIHITDAKEVKNFISFLNKINQVFKNSIKGKDNPQASEYSLHKNFIYSFNEELTAKVKARLVFTSKEKVIEEYFSNLSLYINGKDLFNFFSANKKYINEIEEQDDGLHLKTSIPELEFLIPKLVSKTSNDIILYNNFKTKLYNKYIKNKNFKEQYILSEDEVKKLIASDIPITFNCNGYKVKVTKNTLMGLKSTTSFVSKLIFRFYETDVDDIYVVVAVIDNTSYTTKFCSENYFTIINY